MSVTRYTILAFAVSIASVACDVEDDTSTSRTSVDGSALIDAKEDARLAMQSFVDCDTVSSEDCASEEEALLEALQEVDRLHGEDDELRAACYAVCPSGPGVSCDGSYACTAQDGWGCTSYVLLNGVPVAAHAQCPSNSCEGHCGAQAPAGCWCDAFCTQFGDCCPNKEQWCPSPQVPPPGCFESDGSGNPTPSGSYDAWRIHRATGGYDFWLCNPALGCSDYPSGCSYGGFHP